MLDQVPQSSTAPVNLSVRAGAIALAIGANIASPNIVHASVMVFDTPQPFPAQIIFNGVIRFQITAPPGVDPIIFDATGQNAIAKSDATTAATVDPDFPIDADAFDPATVGSTATLPRTKANPYYIALDVLSAPGLHNYGYASVGLNSDGDPSVIVRYGFETDPNVAIFAGADATPAVVPEPASLVLLSMGAAGALAIRRRAKPART